MTTGLDNQLTGLIVAQIGDFMDASWVDCLSFSPPTDAPRPSSTTTPDPQQDTALYRASRAVIRVRRGGRGRTLVLAPDPPNVIEHHERVVELLARSFQVVCLEMPGFGFSKPHRGYAFTIDDTAQAMIEVLEQVARPPYVLALPCAAGLVSLEIARRQPGLVSHLITLQTGSWSEEVRWSRRVDPGGLIGIPYLGQALVRLGRRRLAGKWYRAAAARRDDAELFTAAALNAYDRGARYCLASVFQALQRSPLPRFVLPQPALCLWGTEDQTHRYTDKRSIQEYLPAARFVEMPGAGHFPDLEQPERFAELVGAFIG